MKFKLFVLFLILCSAGFLRFYHLSINPPGLTWDEAALGYNAYSILKTGRDEYGKFLPLQLKSFGDYKPAALAYLMIPTIAIVGLNELGVRIPAALFGVGNVLLVFLLTKELFRKPQNTLILGLLACLMMAISPLSIQFSRPAFESNIALFFNLLGTYGFLKGFKNNRWWMIAALSFGLSFFVYQSSRLFVPLLLTGLVGIYRRDIKLDKQMFVSAAILAIFVLGVGWLALFKGQSSRLATLNFFSYTRSQEQIGNIIKEDGLAQSSWQFQLLHGEWWSYTKGLAERYLIYYSPKMLFIDGDYSPRDRVPDLGVLYFFDALLIPLGIIYLIKAKNPSSKVVFLWLLIGSLPAVLSRDLISTNRAFNLVFPYTALSGIGAWYIWLQLKKLPIHARVLLVTFLISIMLANVTIYLDRYFIHAPIEYSQGWVYGSKEEMLSLKELMSKKKYDNIVITDYYGQPYIYYLFYTRYDPARYQRQANLQQFGVDVGHVNKIDNITFTPIYWPTQRGVKNSLFIGTESELPDHDVLPFKQFNMMKKIDFPDKTNAYRIVETL